MYGKFFDTMNYEEFSRNSTLKVVRYLSRVLKM